MSLAGGLALGYPGYVDDVAAALAQFSVLPHTRGVTVRRSSLGSDAPLIGAGGLVFRTLTPIGLQADRSLSPSKGPIAPGVSRPTPPSRAARARPVRR